VIQEAALAKQATVLWGKYRIQWEWVGLAAAIIRTNFMRLPAPMRILDMAPRYGRSSAK
jgi:hypothetical protein